MWVVSWYAPLLRAMGTYDGRPCKVLCEQQILVLF